MIRETQIAIISSKPIQGYGLQKIMSEYFAQHRTELFECDRSFNFPLVDQYDVYFVDADLAMLHYDFFIPRKSKTVILSEREPGESQLFHLDVNRSISEIIDQVQQLMDQLIKSKAKESDTLSNREIDVLKLIIKGHINKEIADELNISLNTVLTHRKNITAKLGIKTVSGLTLYAMMNGYAD